MVRMPAFTPMRVMNDPIRRGMFFSIVEGCMFSVWASALTGNYLTGMALFLGAGGLTLGILGALPALATMLQLVSAPLVVGLDRRRSFLAILSGMQRFGASLAGLIALWLMPAPFALLVFVSLQVLAWACMAPSTVVWQGYMSDLIAPEVRGRYFARRNAWCTVVAMASVLLYGQILDRWPGEPGFRILYYAAFVGAGLNFVAWYLLPELPRGDRSSGRGFWASMAIPLHKPGPHRVSAAFFSAWAFAQGMAAPFYPVMLVQKLDISFTGISILATVTSLTAVVSMQFWGPLQDRVGQPRVIGVLTFMMAAVPALLLGASWGGWPVLIAAHLVQGIAAGGMGLANQTLSMRIAPQEDRASYFAFFAAAAGVTGFLTPVLAGPLTNDWLEVLFILSALISAVLGWVWRTRVEPVLTTALRGL